MRFASSFPDLLRSTIRVSEVVGRKVALRKQGKEYTGLCPFHSEKSPSFCVNDEKEFYHCFGCGAHGDVIKFLMETEGFSFTEAVIRLADEFHLTVPYLEEKTATQDEAKSKQNERYVFLMEETTKYFQKSLLDMEHRTAESAAAILYLKERGLTRQLVQEFRLGYAPNSYNALSQYLLTNCQATSQELLEFGLTSKADTGKEYDKFRHRIMFPIFNKHHYVIAFGGRVLDDSKPKYLNSPETILFHKGENVYNYSLARKSMYEENQVLMVEGYMDAITLYGHGLTNVVAPLGTAVTVNQLELLWRNVDTIVMCLDGDTAGKHAMRRVMELALPLITAKKNLGFIFLPENLDPDEYVQAYGVANLQKLKQNFLPLSLMLWQSVVEEVAQQPEADYFNLSAEQKSLVEYQLQALTAKVTDNFVRKHFQEFFWQQSRFNRHGYHRETTNNVKPQVLQKFSETEVLEINILQLLYGGLVSLQGQPILDEISRLGFTNTELENLKEMMLEVETMAELDTEEFHQACQKFGLDKLTCPSERLVVVLTIAVKNYMLVKLEEDIKFFSTADNLDLEKIRALSHARESLNGEIFTLKDQLGVRS